ncbi:MAG: tripartite tricarboxylate transporter substrate binding protein [Burkholderiales bacterium]|nr:tripartite tricarboxylate transporter substrate binding protein [Burkholderiales bacterium]
MQRTASVALASLAIVAGAAWGQEGFPTKPVRLVVPYAAGGTTDIAGRLLGQRLAAIWKQPVVIDNRLGASGSIGAAVVAKSAPDGYTLVLGGGASMGAYELIYPSRAPYHSLRDFTPLSLLTTIRYVLVVHPAVPARTVKELVVLAKAQPGKLNYGSSAIGSAPQLAAELFKLTVGVDIVHVPFNGAGPAMTALLGGNIQVMFASAPTAARQVEAGKLRALATASASRAPQLPDVATMGEAGFPDVEMDSWSGVLGPAGMPRALVNRINADIVKAVDGEEMRDAFAKLGFSRGTSTPEAMAAFMRKERERVARVVRHAGIKGE